MKIHERVHLGTSALDKQSASVHENKNKNPENFSVPNVKLNWNSKKKTVKNDKGDNVKLTIKKNDDGYIEKPSISEIEKMEKKELKEYIYALFEESQYLQNELGNKRQPLNKVSEPQCEPQPKSTVSENEVRETQVKVSQQEPEEKLSEIDDSMSKKENQEKKKYSCDICGNHFKSYKTRNRHVKAVHEGKKPYKCTICENEYGKNDNLKKHIESVHDKIKRHQCELCHSKFARKANLSEHEKNCGKKKNK